MKPYVDNVKTLFLAVDERIPASVTGEVRAGVLGSLLQEVDRLEIWRRALHAIADFPNAPLHDVADPQLAAHLLPTARAAGRGFQEGYDVAVADTMSE